MKTDNQNSNDIDESLFIKFKNEYNFLKNMQSDTHCVKNFDTEKLYSLQIGDQADSILANDNFGNMNLKPELLEAIYKINIDRPSNIQSFAIPNILKRKNIVFHSQSGTGKTMAFVVSALQFTKSGNGPQIIVLTPTRELSNQIKGVFEQIASGMNIKVCAAVSNFIGNIIDEEIVIGTPGKILGLLKNNVINQNNLEMIIFDEADVLISERAFTSMTLKLLNIFLNVQTIFFSATYSDFAKATLKMIVPDIVTYFKNKNTKPEKIAVYYCWVNEKKKFEAVKKFMEVVIMAQMIIFVGTRIMAEKLTKKLEEDKSTVACIHGNLTPSERDEAAELFANAKKKILVATDVFARGMDIPQVNLILNYDLPFNNEKFEESYIHRIGRAGRFNRCGFIIDFITCQRDLDILETTSVYKENDVLEIDLKKLDQAFSLLD